jgi:hypothetical protein
MSRNGSGVYNLPAGNPVITGTTISTTWANNTLNDIAATLTDSVAADGQTPMTGDLDLNSNKIVNLSPATIAGEAVEFTQFQASTGSAVAITGGTINGATIGATTPATGRFTTLEATSTLTVGGISTFTGNGSFNGTGALKIPAGTTAEQPTAVTGQIRYNTSNNLFEGYGASAWGSLGGGATGGGGDQVFVENSQVVTTNYTIPANKNASSVGTITINSGVTVTVSSGSRWVVL